MLALDFGGVRVDVTQESHKLLVGNIGSGKVDNAAFFLAELVGKDGFKVRRARSEDNLVTEDLLSAFDEQCHIGELFTVKQLDEVSRLIIVEVLDNLPGRSGWLLVLVRN